ncbi:hypothetical protein IQE94_05520 [Synechocystis sp. PCC 7339]|uniref:hypothetical protein n=1 Tax=Synechocystis sp. PCC 7339 TaxID=2782213 RepID=UPI001CBB7597|nr:hypothetical protein [Synechocystis sp. PCC 7339]UAJ73741.1 hypothetical protein IQE94_05520 [Synechocystis sp. PCC 7339]
MTCCIGKARIYYQSPIGFQLNYKLPDGDWETVTAQEPLDSICVQELGQRPVLYDVTYRSQNSIDYNGTILYGEINISTFRSLGPIGTIRYSGPNNYTANGVSASCSTGEGDRTLDIYNGSYPGKLDTEFISIIPVLPDIVEPYKFIVYGLTTQTTFVNIGGLEKCPQVENLGCVMGEENYYDTLLPNQTPGGPIENSCFKKVPAENNCFHVVLETKYKPDAFSDIPHEKLRPPKIETRSQLYLCGLPGCPAEYRIVCCPEGECEPERCPPDTDCSLDCGDFVCCYKNGKVIKTVRK